jgi:hypothetical protein
VTSSRLKSQRWKIETLTFSLPHILSYYLTEIFSLILHTYILYIILSLPFTKWKTNEMKKFFPVIKFVTSILQSYFFMCAFPICSDNFSLYLSHFLTLIIINKKNIFLLCKYLSRCLPLNMLRNRINLILIKLWSSSFVRIHQEPKKRRSRYRRVNVCIISLLIYFPVLNLYLHPQTHTHTSHLCK